MTPMASAIFQFFIFIAIAGAVLYGVYRLAKRNGDLKDFEDQAKATKASVTDTFKDISDHLPKL